MSKKKVVDWILILVLSIIIYGLVIGIFPQIKYRFVTFLIIAVAMYFVYSKTNIGPQIKQMISPNL